MTLINNFSGGGAWHIYSSSAMETLFRRDNDTFGGGAIPYGTVFQLRGKNVLQVSSAVSQQATINPSVVKKLLQLHWNRDRDRDRAADGAKINPDAIVLAAEYLRLFVTGERRENRCPSGRENEDRLVFIFMTQRFSHFRPPSRSTTLVLGVNLLGIRVDTFLRYV